MSSALSTLSLDRRGAEPPAFDVVPLRSTRRIVMDVDLKIGLVGQLLI